MSSPRIALRVLPTLNDDGSRKRVRPKLFEGRWLRRRRVVAWSLLVLFFCLPFFRVNDRPAILLDVAQRQFTFFGSTFFATDGVLLMLLLLGIFVTVIGITAVWGRAFCGWACPQTVYLEFVFRPIERFFEGNRNAQLKLDRDGGGLRRGLKNLTFCVISLVVANVFLAYFVGVETLLGWANHSPWEHPSGFLVMGVTAGLVFFDFASFREQMCTVACPYARLQSVLLDKHSLIVGYDAARGEPRKKGKPVPGGGDCIDCGACVVACPTGIDIRDGLQLECVACGQCIDACNTIMPKIGKLPNLITMSSGSQLLGGKAKIMRPRVLLYAVLAGGLFGALFWTARNAGQVDVTVLRGIGAPFVVQADRVQNQVRVKVDNRAAGSATFRIDIAVLRDGRELSASEADVQVIAPENPLQVAGRRSRTTSLFVVSRRDSFTRGALPVVVRVRPVGEADANLEKKALLTLLGPSHGGDHLHESSRSKPAATGAD